MAFKEVVIKRKKASSKPPRKVFLQVDENNEVRLKSGTWLQKIVGKRAKLLVDEVAGMIALQGQDKKDNTIATSGTFINITDATEALGWDLVSNAWFEVPIEITLGGRRVALRMRKADRMKEPPVLRKGGPGRKKVEENV
jgi:hypothetical protein